jgi:hypothetical protein
MNKYGKFAVLMAIIVGSLSYLAYSGIKGSTTYYKTITELRQMGGEAQTRHVRVGGDVQGNSITHIAGTASSTLPKFRPSAHRSTLRLRVWPRSNCNPGINPPPSVRRCAPASRT